MPSANIKGSYEEILKNGKTDFALKGSVASESQITVKKLCFTFVDHIGGIST